MWTTSELGLAEWQTDDSNWFVDARGGMSGIGVIAPDSTGRESFDSPARHFTLGPVGQSALPIAAEQFVRGDSWHINFPQVIGYYAIRLELEPIVTQRDLLVLESIISIQTDLLDTHPRVDIDIFCKSVLSQGKRTAADGSGAAPISLAVGANCCTSVILGPYDSPFTTDLSSGGHLRLRLFGEFLEKGVIRRARPWIVIDRRGRQTSKSELQGWHDELAASPLPLD